MAVKITGYYKLPNEIEPQLIEFDKVFIFPCVNILTIKLLPSF